MENNYNDNSGSYVSTGTSSRSSASDRYGKNVSTRDVSGKNKVTDVRPTSKDTTSLNDSKNCSKDCSK